MNKQTPKSSESTGQLRQLAGLLSVELSEAQAADILLFAELLDEFNQHTNLVSRSDLETVLKDHVLDSLALVPYLPAGPLKLVDVGSGAGFPALILAIARGDLHLEMIESTGKKCHFLSGVVNRLGLSDRVEIHNARAEELGRQRDWREKFDAGTARAVGHLSLIAELVLPFLRQGGVLLAQKSARQADVESQEASRALSKCGGSITGTVPLNEVALGRASVLIQVVKSAPTPAGIPRTGAALKKPL